MNTKAVKRIPIVVPVGKAYKRDALPLTVRIALTSEGATKAIDAIDYAIQTLTEMRATVVAQSATSKAGPKMQRCNARSNLEARFGDYVTLVGHRVETEAEAQARVDKKHAETLKEIARLERVAVHSISKVSSAQKVVDRLKTRIEKLKAQQ